MWTLWLSNEYRGALISISWAVEMKNKTLSHIWTKKGFYPRYFLFLTHSFSFIWFHNEILKNLQKISGATEFGDNSLRNFRVDVFASEPDQSDQGSAYHFRHWAKVKGAFQLYPLPPISGGIQHAKGVIASDGKRIVCGIGSANLTQNGWNDNIEVWSWDDGKSAPVLLSILESFNSNDKRPISTEALNFWLKAIKGVAKSKSCFALENKGSRKFVHDRINSWCAKNAPIVQANVVSPYYSKTFPEWFPQACGVNKSTNVTFIADGSREHTTGPHQKRLKSLIAEISDEVKSVKAFHPVYQSLPKPLHAKVFELIGKNGRMLQCFGSANFTSKGWNGECPHLRWDLLEGLMVSTLTFSPLQS